jgi:ring-1,2-phenylacetyl-CoA epoxidase subunit PaaA
MVERIHPPSTVFPDSPMTTEYRQTLIRLLADQARAEKRASDHYAGWVSRAPGPDERLCVAHIAYEETGHWYRIVTVLQELGVSVDAIPRHQTSSWFYTLAPLAAGPLRWLDVLLMAFLIDLGAYILVEDFAQSSYAPWAKAAREILAEEDGHPDFGTRFIARYIDEHGRHVVQRGLGKWWRLSLNMFGPPVTFSTDLYLRLGLKFRTNEERRRLFREACEPRIRALGLEVPALRRTTYPYW